jgi:hypothetical protein
MYSICKYAIEFERIPVIISTTIVMAVKNTTQLVFFS